MSIAWWWGMMELSTITMRRKIGYQQTAFLRRAMWWWVSLPSPVVSSFLSFTALWSDWLSQSSCSACISQFGKCWYKLPLCLNGSAAWIPVDFILSIDAFLNEGQTLPVLEKQFLMLCCGLVAVSTWRITPITRMLRCLRWDLPDQIMCWDALHSYAPCPAELKVPWLTG